MIYLGFSKDKDGEAFLLAEDLQAGKIRRVDNGDVVFLRDFPYYIVWKGPWPKNTIGHENALVKINKKIRRKRKADDDGVNYE